MRLWRNIAVGIGSSAWAAIIGLAMVPFYLRYLGVEAYGLVGFFIALQAVFQLFDMGLAPTISREVARAYATNELPQARNLLATLAVFYWACAVLIGLGMMAAAPAIGTYWLKPSAAFGDATVHAVALIGVVIAIRFPIGLYVGAIQGAHRVAEVSALGAAVSTVGAGGAAIVVAFISPTIEAFFIWQVGVAILHVILVRWGAWRIIGGHKFAKFELDWLRRIAGFTAAMSVVMILGVVFAQLDKVILSRTVGLGELGRYTIAGIPARSLSLLTAPVFTVIYARLSSLAATNDHAAMENLYRNGTRLFLAIVMPLSAFVGLFSYEILTIWTGDAALAKVIAPVAAFLIYGSALNTIMVFPFALQLAFGNPRLAALISAVLIVGFLPLLFWMIADFGIVGAAGAWLILNAAYVPFGTWLTHRSLLPGLGPLWLSTDVGLPVAVSAVVIGGGFLFLETLISSMARVLSGAALVPLAFALIICLSPSIWPRYLARRYTRSSVGKFILNLLT